ncbi:hypothetical protein AGLY_012271 [Aphis glycines]|uniref:Uncharacterized protein n=1 Tax=Aphis glycines TaxID=307491 RepID=A0A6G0T9S1_APHGL|nr:hypothetical protein AGLY_012271 [Aphis glycines]
MCNEVGSKCSATLTVDLLYIRTPLPSFPVYIFHKNTPLESYGVQFPSNPPLMKYMCPEKILLLNSTVGGHFGNSTHFRRIFSYCCMHSSLYKPLHSASNHQLNSKMQSLHQTNEKININLPKAIIWYDLLCEININNTKIFLQRYRSDGNFKKILKQTSNLAIELGVPTR